jgi:hypothetical protein
MQGVIRKGVGLEFEAENLLNVVLRTKDDSSMECCKGGVEVYVDERRIPALGLPINLKCLF